MAEGLLQMLGSGQQAQQQQQGNLLGGLFQSESQARRQGRERLLGQALQIAQQQDPIGTGFAVAGGLLGEGIGRAMGRVTPEEARQQKFAGLQTQLMQEGLDPTQNPFGFYARAAELLREQGDNQMSLRASAMARKFAPEPVEMEPATFYNFNTDEYVQGAYANGVPVDPRTNQPLGPGFVERDYETPEDKPAQGQQVEIVDPQDGKVKLGTYDPVKKEYSIDGRVIQGAKPAVRDDDPPIASSLTSADRELFESALSINPDLQEKFDETVEKPKFFGLIDGDEKERKTVLFDRAYNIRRADSSLTAEQALEIAVNEITANFENADTPDAQPGIATPEKDEFAGRINP